MAAGSSPICGRFRLPASSDRQRDRRRPVGGGDAEGGQHRLSIRDRGLLAWHAAALSRMTALARSRSALRLQKPPRGLARHAHANSYCRPDCRMKLAPVQVEHAHGRRLAHERRMALTLSRPCPSPSANYLFEDAVMRFARYRKKDRGPAEERSRNPRDRLPPARGRGPFRRPEEGGSLTLHTSRPLSSQGGRSASKP